MIQFKTNMLIILESDPNVLSVQINVLLDDNSIGEFTSDFLVTFTDGSEVFIKWLDQQHQIVLERLIEENKRDTNSYSDEKGNVLQLIGERYKRLPEIVMDSLTSAEILFKTYGNKRFADQGFDYSCISALYYQAVEASYNLLIWHGYANIVNSAEINGIKIAKAIMKLNKGDPIPDELKGYFNLDNINDKTRYLYRDKNNKKCYARENCMMDNYAELIKTVSKKNKWKDELGRVFIYYTVDEIIEKMGCCKQKALKLLNELKEFGLIECERIRLTKPNRIYVKTYY